MQHVVELRDLLLHDSPARRARTTQWIPTAEEIPTAAAFANLVTAEEEASRAAAADGPLPQRLALLGDAHLAGLEQLRVDVVRLVGEIGFAGTGNTISAPDWVVRAVGDHLAGRGRQLWDALSALKDEPERLQRQLDAQGVSYVVEVEPIARESLGAARGAVDAGRALADYLCGGGRLKRRFPSPVQRDAQGFLALVQVNGRSPDVLAHVVAAVERLEAEVAVVQLAAAWADRSVEVPIGRLPVTLSDLADKAQLLDKIKQLADLRARVSTMLAPTGLSTEFPDPTGLIEVLDAVPAARRRLRHERAWGETEELHRWVQAAAGSPKGCPELATLLRAIPPRDTDGYRTGLEELARAEAERHDAMRLAHLTEQLRTVHPALLELLQRTAAEPVWDQRLPELAAAWAWSKARDFVMRSRTATRERELLDEFTRVEDELKLVTQRLAGTEALLACLDRMTDAHARALRAYRDHMTKVGAGTGKRVRAFQSAARAAMEKAKGAVPAWVVPLPNLLDNLAVERDSFDVVIVDEASQVGMEHLFLLWLAPRVIVVGDDKQCTPGEARMGQQDRIFESLPRYLGAADEEIRMIFTPKSNLYGLLSARSGKDAVIRLREHFRCVPEIINWSSNQFYGAGGVPGLIPLRERTAADLEPLKVVTVTGAFTEGRNATLRNPVEAEMIADELTRCVNDPRYTAKTFGVVVLQGRGQVRLLEHELNARLTPEQRVERKVRVGVPADFQGDERDVIFLSMVVANPPRAQRAIMAQQSYNVAASRAKDQMWLFTSVRAGELKPDDLRWSLLDYMQDPPSTYGRSLELDEVSDTRPCAPFESLFEQRVFREIRGRGYHVVPQYPVGSRRLDLLVVGDGGRLAVECDGHRWHTSVEQVASDARRDRELHRMRWEVLRIRESEFEFDRDRALAPLWTALRARGIEPFQDPGDSVTPWEPVELVEMDEDEDHEDDEEEGSSETDDKETGSADQGHGMRGELR
ncbi:MAG: DUF559 domain-containing protein [Actinobacteria bacterium]|nr:DUF559 domain-containing protein [Actinomycetota bacterium]